MVRYHLFIYVALKDEASIILWGVGVGGKLSRLNKCSLRLSQSKTKAVRARLRQSYYVTELESRGLFFIKFSKVKEMAVPCCIFVTMLYKQTKITSYKI